MEHSDKGATVENEQRQGRSRQESQHEGSGVGDSEVLAQIIALLNQLNPEDRERVFHTLGTFFDIKGLHARAIQGRVPQSGLPEQPRVRQFTFSEDLDLSPKEFLLQKQSRTDVERVACLAYYLTHFRDTPHFKTIDITKLNTEAAQRKFANSTWAVHNSLKTGYLVQAAKGHRQLSVFGEQFVQMLPDRDAAKKVMRAARPIRSSRRRRKGNKVGG